MELSALYKCVIGLDVHQAQITACALIQQPDGSTRIEQRQFAALPATAGNSRIGPLPCTRMKS